MPDYRIRYVVGYDFIGRPVYHSVTIGSDVVPDADQAMTAALMNEEHLYADTGAGPDEIELDEIRELLPTWIYTRPRPRFTWDDFTGQWTGPHFDGPAHGFLLRKPPFPEPQEE